MKTNHSSKLFARLYALLILLIPFRRQKEEESLSPIEILPDMWRNAYYTLYEPNKDLKGRPPIVLSAKMTDLQSAMIRLLKEVRASGGAAFFGDLPALPNAGRETIFGDNRELAAKQMYMMLSGYWAVQPTVRNIEKVQENVSELAKWYAEEYKRRIEEFDTPIKELIEELFRKMEISENKMRDFVSDCNQKREEIFALERKIDNIVIKAKNFYRWPFLADMPYLSDIITSTEKKWVNLRTRKLRAKMVKLQERLFDRERREEAVKDIISLRKETENLHEAIRARSREVFPLPVEPAVRNVFPHIFLNSEGMTRK